MSPKAKNILKTVLTGLIALLFIASALGKLFGPAAPEDMAQKMGGLDSIKMLGILELAIVAIWLLPKTAVAGALLLIAYMGGAMAVHYVNHLDITGPAVVQIAVWIVSAVRFPELTQRLLGKKNEVAN